MAGHGPKLDHARVTALVSHLFGLDLRYVTMTQIEAAAEAWSNERAFQADQIDQLTQAAEDQAARHAHARTNYERVLGHLQQSATAQQKEIETLRARVESLESLIKTLEW